eukprot:tig00001181_g7448.t1
MNSPADDVLKRRRDVEVRHVFSLQADESILVDVPATLRLGQITVSGRLFATHRTIAFFKRDAKMFFVAVKSRIRLRDVEEMLLRRARKEGDGLELVVVERATGRKMKLGGPHVTPELAQQIQALWRDAAAGDRVERVVLATRLRPPPRRRAGGLPAGDPRRGPPALVLPPPSEPPSPSSATPAPSPRASARASPPPEPRTPQAGTPSRALGPAAPPTVAPPQWRLSGSRAGSPSPAGRRLGLGAGPDASPGRARPSHRRTKSTPAVGELRGKATPPVKAAPPAPSGPTAGGAAPAAKPPSPQRGPSGGRGGGRWWSGGSCWGPPRRVSSPASPPTTPPSTASATPTRDPAPPARRAAPGQRRRGRAWGLGGGARGAVRALHLRLAPTAVLRATAAEAGLVAAGRRGRRGRGRRGGGEEAEVRETVTARGPERCTVAARHGFLRGPLAGALLLEARPPTAPPHSRRPLTAPQARWDFRALPASPPGPGGPPTARGVRAGSRSAFSAPSSASSAGSSRGAPPLAPRPQPLGLSRAAPAETSPAHSEPEARRPTLLGPAARRATRGAGATCACLVTVTARVIARGPVPRPPAVPRPRPRPGPRPGRSSPPSAPRGGGGRGAAAARPRLPRRRRRRGPLHLASHPPRLVGLLRGALGLWEALADRAGEALCAPPRPAPPRPAPPRPPRVRPRAEGRRGWRGAPGAGWAGRWAAGGAALVLLLVLAALSLASSATGVRRLEARIEALEAAARRLAAPPAPFLSRD